MNTLDRFIRLMLAPALGCALLLSGPALHAQELPTTPEGVEVDNAISDLRDIITDRPADPRVLDTAMIFTNQTATRSIAACVAYDQDGKAIGRAWTRIPAHGLRYIRASDIGNGADFVGSAHCVTRGHVTGSAIVVGAGFSDVPVKQGHRWGESRIRFALIASY